MNGKKDLKSWVSKIESVAIDTNVLIYQFDQNLQFYQTAQKLLNQLISQNKEILSSIMTLIELLSFSAPKAAIQRLEEDINTLPNLNLIVLDRDIGIQAARIRRENHFGIVDSVQLATALAMKADVFITNDTRLKSFKELKVVLLSEF